MMYDTFGQPVMGANTPMIGSAAQYGLQIIQTVLSQLIQQGQITQYEASVIMQRFNEPDVRNDFVNRINKTYGYHQVNVGVVNDTVAQMLLGAAIRIRQQNQNSYMTPNASALMNNTMYGMASAMFGNPQMCNTDNGYQQSPQPQTPVYQEPPQQPVNTNIDVPVVGDMEICEPATIEDASELKSQRATFNIAGVQTLSSASVVKCGQLSVINMNFAYRIPVIDRSVLIDQLRTPESEIVMLEDYLHVNMVEWYRMYPFPKTPSISPFKLLDSCQNIYKEFLIKQIALPKDKKLSVVPVVQEINKKILSDGGAFGIQMESFLIGQINKFVSVVFNRYEQGQIKSISGFEDFKDFNTILSKESSPLDAWKTNEKAFSFALGRLISTVYQRLFNQSRKPYLDMNNEDDRHAFVTNPHIPYRFNGRPLWAVSPKVQQTDAFRDFVMQCMRDCPVIVMPQRTLFHNLTWSKNITAQKRTLITERTPVEQIIDKLLVEKYLSLLEVVHDVDFTKHVIGRNYNEFLVLKSLG